MPPPPLPENVASQVAPAKILASPKFQGPSPKVSSIIPPAETPMAPGEQVRIRGRAVLTAVDPETEPEPSSSSVQRAVAQGEHNRNINRMLAKLHACRDYSAPSDLRVPPSNIQDNPEYKEAYTALFELPDRHGVGISTVQAISRDLMVSYEAVRFYEQALLKVEQQLYEQTDLEARLCEEIYKVDKLSSIIQAQDEHKFRLEEARINAENTQRAVTEDLEHSRFPAEAAHREVSRKLKQERQEKIAISRLLEICNNQMNAEISELTISRQQAVLRYEFACTQHSDDMRAIRQDCSRLRQQLYEAYRMCEIIIISLWTNYRQNNLLIARCQSLTSCQCRIVSGVWNLSALVPSSSLTNLK